MATIDYAVYAALIGAAVYVVLWGVCMCVFRGVAPGMPKAPDPAPLPWE